MGRRDQHMLNLSFENSEVDYDRRCLNNLLEAVLERAIRDALGNSSITQHTIREAREWFYAKDTEEWSFLWIVEALQLSSKFIAQIHNRIPRYLTPPSVPSDSVCVVPLSKNRRGLIPSRIPNELRIIYQPAIRQKSVRRKRS